MSNQSPNGICSYCEESFSKRGIARHLAACEQRQEAIQEPLGMGRGETRETAIYHLKAEGTYAPMYWLHIEIAGDLPLADLDQFLRGIWLECCGHLSAFDVDGIVYHSDAISARQFGESTMNKALKSVLTEDTHFSHEYDFGTTTDLSLQVMGIRQGKAAGKVVQVMARNEPPVWPCAVCGEPASEVCAMCFYEGEGWLCEEHASAHQCGEEMLLPVVNSPRVGECAYAG